MPSPLNEIRSWHFRSQVSLHDPEERLAGLEALRIRNDQDLLVRRCAELLADSAPEVREAAAEALITVGGRKAAEIAGDVLEHAEIGPRMAAVSVLAGIGRAGVGPSVHRLDHESPAVRAAAVRALGEIGARTSLDEVACLLGDPNPEVVTEAARAVGALGGTDYIPDLHVVYRRVPPARLTVLETLARLDAHASLELFESVVRAGDPELRSAAIEGLRAADSPRARRILQSVADTVNAE